MQDFPYAEDKLFNMQCYVCRAKYAFIEEIGYVYRRNEASVSYQYNPNSSDCWLGIARRLKGWLEEKGEDEAVYGGLVEYTVFFASFFDAKKEYEQHGHSLRAIRKVLKIYGRDGMGGLLPKALRRKKSLRAGAEVLAGADPGLFPGHAVSLLFSPGPWNPGTHSSQGR